MFLPHTTNPGAGVRRYTSGEILIWSSRAYLPTSIHSNKGGLLSDCDVPEHKETGLAQFGVTPKRKRYFCGKLYLRN